MAQRNEWNGPVARLYETGKGAFLDKICSLVLGAMGYFVIPPCLFAVTSAINEFASFHYSENWVLVLAVAAIVFAIGYAFLNYLRFCAIAFAVAGASLLVASIPTQGGLLFTPSQWQLSGSTSINLGFLFHFSGVLLVFVAFAIPVGQGLVRFVRFLERKWG